MSAPALSPGPTPREGDEAGASAVPGSVPGSAPTHRPTASFRHASHKPGVLHAIQSLLAIIVVAVFIVTFTMQPFRIPSGSMEPTLLVGDFLLVDKEITADAVGSLLIPSPRIHRGDVIVFYYPIDPSLHLVKRVVGVPGDHIRLRGGHVLVNGLRLEEPYAIYRPSPPDNYRDNFPRLQNADPAIDSRWWVKMRRLIDNGELIVPEGNYFVLGDNRNNSEDSRYWGFVPKEAIVGRPLLIYFSLRQEDGLDYTLPRTAGIALEAPGAQSSVLSFARWDRVLRVVR